MSGDFKETVQFHRENDPAHKVEVILTEVYRAMREKGYDPIYQLVGYIISGDPTYITSHGGARMLIGRMERDDILEVILRHFMDTKDISK